MAPATVNPAHDPRRMSQPRCTASPAKGTGVSGRDRGQKRRGTTTRHHRRPWRARTAQGAATVGKLSGKLSGNPERRPTCCGRARNPMGVSEQRTWLLKRGRGRI